MKKNIFQFLAILMLMVFSLGSFAQDNRTLDTKVADVLAQMPTKNLAHLEKAMVEILDLGSEGFQKLCTQLSAPDEGDDTAVRFAINSFSRYASQFGKTEARIFAEENLLKALKTHDDAEVKTFIMNQLNLVVSEKSIDELSAYLNHPELCEPATQTLLSMNNKAVAKVFLASLPQSSEKNKATLIRALGEIKCEGAVSVITPFVDAQKTGLQKTALSALAKIASPDSYKTLLKAATNVGFNYDATNASASFIEYLDNLGAKNELELMRKGCKEIFKANTSESQLHNYSAALAISTKYLGYEATPLLLDAVDNPNKAFRYSVLNLAENLGGIADTRKWIEKAENSLPDIKVDIIAMLGRRGCSSAFDFIVENLKSESELFRDEVIIALEKLEGSKANSILIQHLAEGKNIETTKATLLQNLDNKHLSPVVLQLDKTSGKTKAAFIEIIAAKAGTQYFNEIRKAISTNSLVEKDAAFAALKRVSSEENLEDLIELLLHVKMENYISEVQQAVVAAARGVKSEQGESGKILGALKTTDKKERILAILPEIGGELALQTVVGYFNSSSGTTKNVAFEALTNWKEYSAAKELYNICKTASGDYKSKALSNFVRMVRTADLPDDQKLLQYRKIMPFANSAEEKNYVISSIGYLKTFLSVVYLEQFLAEPGLAEATSRAIMRICLPDSNGENGLSGDIVRRILAKAEITLSGEDSQYDKINIKKYLDEMPGYKGFVSMFNGKNLEGWQGMLLDGNPIKIAELSDEKRAKLQQEADIKMLENWSVKNGQIVFSGKGHNLVSSKKYSDFELIVDWLITKEGDSGIYLRGTPQVQIWDTSRVEVGAQVGSGGLYNNNRNNVRDPLKVADNPINEWNTFRITMIGEHVTVFLNGELVVDNVKMDNYWNREIPIFSEGTIELQAHGNELAFRDVYVREINTEQIGLTQDEIDEGFVSLFNGKNLNGWQGNLTDYYAENGELVVNPKMGGHGNVYTEKEYSDFIFRFEFQLTPGANNGLGIRTPREGDAAYVGMELQILDNSAPVYANLHTYQYHASVYGVIPAKRGFQNPVGEWNTQEVIAKGSRIKITLNGEVVLDGDIKEASKNGTLDKKEHPGLLNKKGYIGFLGHGSELKFRNIRIKDLSK